jgi:tRNA 5-methylaminomethyl-2-thiouridine biosynthesis bifunctional protein
VAKAWAGCARYVVVDTDFALGKRYLRLWQSWRQDTARCERLVVVVLAQQLPSASALRQAHRSSDVASLAEELAHGWPPLTLNLHTLRFDEGRVQLLLAPGPPFEVLRSLHVQANELWVQGDHPCPWLKWLGRLAAPGAHLHFASAPLPSTLQLAVSAGFALDPAAGATQRYRYAPRQGVRSPPRLLTANPGAYAGAYAGAHAVVVGAGLAGAAAAQALQRQGMRVTVFEARASVAAAASGNAAGIFHGTVNTDDGIYARLFRAAALAAADEYEYPVRCAAVPGSTQGLLRLEWRDTGLAGMQAILRRTGLPTSYVQALSASQASQRAGVPLPGPAWYYPRGGWLAPAAWVRYALKGVRCALQTPVAGLQRDGARWQVLGSQQQVLAQADVVVLANGHGAASLAQQLGHAPWPLSQTRGQVTQWASAPGLPMLPRLPVAGDGYVLATGKLLLCGATREVVPLGLGTAQPIRVRQADHKHNLQRLQRLTGQTPPAHTAAVLGRAAWRLHTDDRLPIAGPLPLATQPPQQRSDQVRLLPRESGLFVLTALGARGLTLAPLLAQLVAAQACGAPWPLEQQLVDAVDPARWWVRNARRAASRAGF